MKQLGKRTKQLLIILLPLLALSIWYGSSAVGYAVNLRAFVIPPGANSMAPALLPGDRIAVDMRGGIPKRGEIWTFAAPGGMTLIKRVIGLPGETIEVAAGEVLINGEPLAEPYLVVGIKYTLPPLKLSPDQYFMLGDSRNTSNDSHIWGPLDKKHLIGRAENRFWPQARIGPVR